MNIQNKQAFTLVELIVVITILAILGTIAFVSLQGYSKTARDVKRIADIQNIKKSLELFYLNTGEYPFPDNPGEVSYSGELVWTQGFVGDNITTNLSRNLQNKPTDPLTENEYTYSLTNALDEYQLLAMYESDYKKDLLPQVNAAKKLYPRIGGTYNELYVMTPNYIVPTPSIITSEDISGGLVLDDTNIKSQIISYGSNVPSVGSKQAITGGLDINLSVYTGSITYTTSDEDKRLFATALQGAYTGSILATQDIYKIILEKSTPGELLSYVNEVFGNNQSGETQAPTGGSFTINNNAASIATTSVTLNIVCPTDVAGSTPISVAYGNSSNPTNWSTCATTKSHTLTTGNGTKTVYVRFKDNLGNTTSQVSDSIILEDNFDLGNNIINLRNGNYIKCHGGLTVTSDYIQCKYGLFNTQGYKMGNYDCTNRNINHSFYLTDIGNDIGYNGDYFLGTNCQFDYSGYSPLDVTEMCYKNGQVVLNNGNCRSGEGSYITSEFQICKNTCPGF